MTEIVQKKRKNSKGRILGTLAFRVLVVNFIFVVVPLIIYSFLIYGRNYEKNLRAVFEELYLVQQDQISLVKEFEALNLNFLDTVKSFIDEIEGDQTKKIESILSKFSRYENLSGISFFQVEGGKVFCMHSTLPLYEGVDFTSYFNEDFLKNVQDNVFIAKDPLFIRSLYLIYKVKDGEGNLRGVLAASIALDRVVEQLDKVRSVYDTNVSILSSGGEVIATTDPHKIGLQFKIKNETNKELVVQEGKSLITLKKMDGVVNGFSYFFQGKARFSVIDPFPYTDALIILSVPSDVILYQMYEYIGQLVSFLFFILVVGGIASYLFTLRIAKPMNQLRNVMVCVGEGKLETRFAKDPLGFEINYLGEKFNDMVISLIEYIETANRERASKETYAKELQIGHEIQKSILPKKEGVFPGIEMEVYFNPAKEVAGDFYDWMIRGDKVILTIADGVGKGVSSALYSFDLRSILRAFAVTEEDIGKVVVETNRLFMHDTKDTGSFVTAFVAVFDSTKSTLNFANCGHNHPILKHPNGEIARLEAKGIAFGVQDFETVAVGHILLVPGDLVVFFTDGVSEAQNKKGELFGEKRLEEVIKNAPYDNPGQIVQSILKAVETFVDGADQYDDMTLVIFRILPR
jgi:sigma-B regulation protein RsbU (phosphoserine phosphatase)